MKKNMTKVMAMGMVLTMLAGTTVFAVDGTATNDMAATGGEMDVKEEGFTTDSGKIVSVEKSGTDGVSVVEIENKNGGLRFANHCTVHKVTSQLGKEVIEHFCILTGEFYRTESHQIHVFHSGIRQGGNLSPVLLCLTDSTIFFQCFFIQIVKSLGFHHRNFFRQCPIRK